MRVKSAYLGSIMCLSLYILIYSNVNVKITLIAMFWDVLMGEHISFTLNVLFESKTDQKFPRARNISVFTFFITKKMII